MGISAASITISLLRSRESHYEFETVAWGRESWLTAFQMSTCILRQSETIRWKNCVPFGTPSDRKSTRLNSSHFVRSYAVFCLKKKHDRPSTMFSIHMGRAPLIHYALCLTS